MTRFARLSEFTGYRPNAISGISVAMSDNTPHVKAPREFSAAQKKRFIALVREGGEVADGLQNRIERAAFLLMIEHAGTVRGVAALKVPDSNYRSRTFRKANCSASASDYNFEIGWIFVPKECRGEGLSNTLVKLALDAADGANVFATTRSDNFPMQHVLKKHGFEVCGTEYPSTQNPGSNLRLLLADTNAKT